MLSISEYAESRKISYEAVRKQVKAYKKTELKKHITYEGRTALLDDFAVDFLDQHRQKRNIILAPTEKEIEEELAQLRNKVLQLQEELLKRTDDMNALLKEEKLLIADKAVAETKAAELDSVKKELNESRDELSKYHKVFLGFYRKIK